MFLVSPNETVKAKGGSLGFRLGVLVVFGWMDGWIWVDNNLK